MISQVLTSAPLFFRWFRHISEASNAYKNRQGSDRARGGSVGHGIRGRRDAEADVQNGLLVSAPLNFTSISPLMQLPE